MSIDGFFGFPETLSSIWLAAVLSFHSFVHQNGEKAVNDGPHVKVDDHPQQSNNDPQNPAGIISVDEENHGGPDHRNQEANDQHQSQDDPWSHQNIIALK
jgi:hypothetical protein